MCIKYEYLQCTLLYLHIYTGGMLKAWPVHNMRRDLISQLTRYLFKCLIYTVFILPSSYELTIITVTMAFYNEKWLLYLKPNVSEGCLVTSLL